MVGEHLAVPVLQADRVGDAEESGVPTKCEQVRGRGEERGKDGRGRR